MAARSGVVILFEVQESAWIRGREPSAIVHVLSRPQRDTLNEVSDWFSLMVPARHRAVQVIINSRAVQVIINSRGNGIIRASTIDTTG